MVFVCPFCNFLSSSKLPHNGSNSLRTGKEHLDLDKLAVLLSDADDLCLWTDEKRMLHHIVEKAYACSASLAELVNFALAYVGKDLGAVSQKLCITLKALNISGIYDNEGYHKFELALARHSWKRRAEKLLESLEKPTLQKIQHGLKEVSADGGVLRLDRVFELISEGESLPVTCAEELKLLRDRSMLYCICQRPYDQRAMIACDKCDEWYHFDCVNITSAPKIYICIACTPHPTEDTYASAPTIQDRFTGGKFEEPQTPLRRSELRMNSQKPKSISKKIIVPMDHDSLRNCSSTNKLLWRNRKRFRRAARKRSELQSLSPLNVQNKGLT